MIQTCDGLLTAGGKLLRGSDCTRRQMSFTLLWFWFFGSGPEEWLLSPYDPRQFSCGHIWVSLNVSWCDIFNLKHWVFVASWTCADFTTHRSVRSGYICPWKSMLDVGLRQKKHNLVCSKINISCFLGGRADMFHSQCYYTEKGSCVPLSESNEHTVNPPPTSPSSPIKPTQTPHPTHTHAGVCVGWGIWVGLVLGH